MNRRTAVAAGVVALGVLGVSGAPAWAASGGNGRGPSASSASSGSASTRGDAPPGNNGHIQIDEYAMDGGSGNDPHVACGFSVSFFGYDAGTQKATVTITPWAPTAGGHPATFGPLSWSVDHRTGGNQRDFNYPVSPADVKAVFAGVTPAHQGYHARVEVEVSGSQGSDDKFKMLWISPCTGSAAPAAGSTVAGESAAPSPGGTSQGSTAGPAGTTSGPAAVSAARTAPPAGSTAGSPSASPAGTAGLPTEVLGEVISSAEASGLPPLPAGAARATSAPAGGLLAFTGANIAGLSGLALAMAGGGLVLVRRSRRPLSR